MTLLTILRSRIPPSASWSNVTNFVVKRPRDFSNLELESPGVSIIMVDDVLKILNLPPSHLFTYANQPNFFAQKQPDSGFQNSQNLHKNAYLLKV